MSHVQCGWTDHDRSCTGIKLLYNLSADPSESKDLYAGGGANANKLDLLAASMEQSLLAYANGSKGAVAFPMLQVTPQAICHCS